MKFSIKEFLREIVVRNCSCEKGVLNNFAKFTGKQLCQNLFFNKVAGVTRNFKNTFFKKTPPMASILIKCGEIFTKIRDFSCIRFGKN